MNKEQGVLFPVPLEFTLDDTSESTVEIHASGNSVLYPTVYTVASMIYLAWNSVILLIIHLLKEFVDRSCRLN